jgi:restriction endonuclease S subunit
VNIHVKEPLKYVATINDETLTEETDIDRRIKYIDIGNVDSTGSINEVAEYRFEDAPSRARRVVRDGDVIISTVRTYLQAIAFIESPPDDLIVSTDFAVVRSRENKLNANYCKYALRSPEFIGEVVSRSVGISYPAINSSDLVRIEVYVPSLSQQSKIADYLDRQTQKIDALIAAKKRLLELLAEKRRSLITHAVTHGLNDDVAIEYLGEVPKQWNLRPLKYLLSFMISTNATTINQDMKALKYSRDILPSFLTRQLQVRRDEILTMTRESGHGTKAMETTLLKNIAIVIPPPEEQETITKYIDSKSIQIDLLIDSTKKTIALLQERRTSLISAAVTGQLSIPD